MLPLTQNRWFVTRRHVTTPNASGSVVEACRSLPDLVKAEHVIFEAFMDSPMARWEHPDVLGRLRMMQEFYSKMVREPAPMGLVHQIDGFAAVAAWQTNSMTFAWMPGNDNEAELERVFDEQEEEIMRGVPFYYHLNLLATAADKMNMGYAGALMQPMLDLADEQQVPLYLENTAVKEITAFYERRGFVTKHEHQFDEEGQVVIRFMRRDPRPKNKEGNEK